MTPNPTPEVEFAGRKILVLGGLGFIGSNLARRLAAIGARVTVVDNLVAGCGGNVHNLDGAAGSIDVVRADIGDTVAMGPLVAEASHVFCLSGQSSHVHSMAEPVNDLDLNARAHLSLFEVCRRTNPDAILIRTSTRQVYGAPRSLPVDEDHPPAPSDILAVHNLAIDNYLTLYAKAYDMRCVSLRLTNTYGPRQQLRGTMQGVAGVFLRQALDGEGIVIFGDGRQRRDFLYVEDAVEALLAAAATPGLRRTVYNIGSDEVYSLIEFVELFKIFRDIEVRRVSFPPEYRAVDIGDYYSDFSRFSAETGWQPRVSIEDGLARTVAYFCDRMDFYR